MKKAIFLILLLFLPALSFAQLRVPDNDDIFNRTVDRDSPFYYPALMLRYNAGDLTLTEEDYYYLYYGYAYTDDYSPLSTIPAEDRVLVVFEATENPDYNQMLEIISAAREVMKKDPFSPKNLNFLTYAYGSIGDTINERINHERMTKIINTIAKSGTGEKDNSPMHVIKFSHAADLLTSRGLTITNRRVEAKGIEFISVAERENRNRGYYFDFSRVFWSVPEDMPKPERRWQFNNLPLKKK